jgi:hypothetical protein
METDTTPTGATSPDGTADVAMSALDLDHGLRADVDDGEVYAPLTIGRNEIPARRQRLRLRELTEEEMETAGAVVERLSAALSAKITDASD